MLLLVLFRRDIFLPAPNSSFHLLRSNPLNYISDKQMAWHESVEDGTKDEVFLSVIVASDTDKDTVLGHRQYHRQTCRTKHRLS